MSGRIRTIKPELLEDAVTARLSSVAFRTFIALIVLADDYGNFRAEPLLLKAHIFWSVEPEKDFEEVLSELEGLVTFYTVRGQRYGRIRSWAKNQKVQKPGLPRVPGPEQADASPSWKQSRNVPESRTVPPCTTDSGDSPEILQQRSGESPGTLLHGCEGAGDTPETPRPDLRPGSPITDHGSPIDDLRSTDMSFAGSASEPAVVQSSDRQGEGEPGKPTVPDNEPSTSATAPITPPPWGPADDPPEQPPAPPRTDGAVEPSSSTQTRLRLELASNDTGADDVQVVYEHYVRAWRRAVTGTRPPVLTGSRRKMVRKRLREFSVDELKLAVDGLFSSDFNLGANDRGKRYVSLELLFRTTEQVEKYLVDAPAPEDDFDPPPFEVPVLTAEEQEAQRKYAREAYLAMTRREVSA